MRIFYFGMVATQAYSKEIGQDLYVGAASGKMVSIVAALRAVGRRAVLVSLPFPGVTAKASNFPAVVTYKDGIPAVFLPVICAPIKRKLYGLWAFAGFSFYQVRRCDVALFYNHSFEYLLALIILRARGVRIFHDIEDAPNFKDFEIRSILSRLSYNVMIALSSSCKVIASEQMARDLNIREFVAVQGVASNINGQARPDTWQTLSQGGPLRVHYGGSLMHSTGLDLFCDMVEFLQNRPWSGLSGVEFEITGIGNMDRLRSLAERCPDGLSVNVHGTLTLECYDALFSSCHAGLSLRMPDEHISSTTFPSKVIEITSRGLALVSSVVSDVGSVFSDENAFLLHDFTHQSLANAIYMMAANPDEVRRRALAGQKLADKRFNPRAVGERLAGFLELGRNSN